VFRHPAFVAGETHTHFIEQHMAGWKPPVESLAIATIAAAITALRKSPDAVNTNENEDQSPWTTLGDWRIGTERS
jgi:hypothetical protein